MKPTEESRKLGAKIGEHRARARLTLTELSVETKPEASAKPRVSASHLGRIERGERSPSAKTLQAIAEALNLGEVSVDELFILAGYPFLRAKKREGTGGHLDPYVAELLAQEPLEVQRAIPFILLALKNIVRAPLS